ncbi:MAG TPA: 1,4-alpha-glucan branching protein GlgB [Anaerovoracaceae bacterium]|nr:1,4-alpha-glucan branching protein GlgB [Anaerovoracaceae bacterium]
MIANIISQEEAALFREGGFYSSYSKFGAHLSKDLKNEGVYFTVWAPNAVAVSVEGDFNDWDGTADYMEMLDGGIWTIFIPKAKKGDAYKYLIKTKKGDFLHKGDPFAFFSEVRPKTASIVFDLDQYEWKDKNYQKHPDRKNHLKRPMNIYEVNLTSWKKNLDGSCYTYSQLKKELIPYVLEMGYTHIEVMPLTEHPFDGSWGYQATGYYSATSRFGNPDELRDFIDACHDVEIGVIMDWVPGHFCMDAHGLGEFDGTPLYEAEIHKHWGTYKTNFKKKEVLNFFLSNGIFWIEQFHFDGIRVDGVTSMLYLNFDSEHDAFKTNIYGGRENIEAIAFIRKVNSLILEKFPNAMMIAEESTAWANVTKPPYDGGLGFNYKWNMGWMNDTLKYIELPFDKRINNHHLLTFSLVYAFSENFILPISHDEVVHGKKSLLDKMYGDNYNKFSGDRSLAIYQITQPGKKLNFMGNEFAQYIEWKYEEGLEWFMLDYTLHRQFQQFTKKLNWIYRENRALYENDTSLDSFDWLDVNNSNQSVLIYQRKVKGNILVVVINFKPEGYPDYRLAVDKKGNYKELINSDSIEHGGNGYFINGNIKTEEFPYNGKKHSMKIKLPPLAGVIFKLED